MRDGVTDIFKGITTVKKKKKKKKTCFQEYLSMIFVWAQTIYTRTISAKLEHNVHDLFVRQGGGGHREFVDGVVPSTRSYATAEGSPITFQTCA